MCEGSARERERERRGREGGSKGGRDRPQLAEGTLVGEGAVITDAAEVVDGREDIDIQASPNTFACETHPDVEESKRVAPHLISLTSSVCKT